MNKSNGSLPIGGSASKRATPGAPPRAGTADGAGERGRTRDFTPPVRVEFLNECGESICGPPLGGRSRRWPGIGRTGRCLPPARSRSGRRTMSGRGCWADPSPTISCGRSTWCRRCTTRCRPCRVGRRAASPSPARAANRCRAGCSTIMVFGPPSSARGVNRIRFHDLRHKVRQPPSMAGKRPKYIADQMGHASAAFTLDTYGHLMVRLPVQPVEWIDDLIFREGLEAALKLHMFGAPNGATGGHAVPRGEGGIRTGIALERKHNKAQRGPVPSRATGCHRRRGRGPGGPRSLQNCRRA